MWSFLFDLLVALFMGKDLKDDAKARGWKKALVTLGAGLVVVSLWIVLWAAYEMYFGVK